MNFVALTLLCAVVYRPPKYNKDFLNDFSDFLAEIMPKYDSVLIVGDFNVHVCCPDKPMAKDFLNLNDSFNLVQSVVGRTQERGHTLDLVLSFGLPVFNLEVCDAAFSDHMPVLFEVALACNTVKPRAAARRCRIINPSTAAQFSAVFCQTYNCVTECMNNDTEELSSWFHSTCQSVLDTVAPLKTRQSRTKSEPWLNDTTRTVRRECRRVERKWKRDKLQVSFQILDCWHHYQTTVRNAKRKHFSDIILSNCHNPRVLFKTIDSALNAPQTVCIESSPAVCENFLHFFIDKVASTRALISPSAYDVSVSVPCSAVFDRFEPVTLSLLQETVGQLKPSGSPNDVVPPRLFKEVLPTIGSSVLTLINSSLSSGVVPEKFKHAVVQPLIKKTGLDSAVLANYRPISKLPFISKILEKIVSDKGRNKEMPQNTNTVVALL